MFPGEHAVPGTDLMPLPKGPLIEANEGDTIVVHVQNDLNIPQSIRKLLF